jgi:hypothetical protein
MWRRESELYPRQKALSSGATRLKACAAAVTTITLRLLAGWDPTDSPFRLLASYLVAWVVEVASKVDGLGFRGVGGGVCAILVFDGHRPEPIAPVATDSRRARCWDSVAGLRNESSRWAAFLAHRIFLLRGRPVLPDLEEVVVLGLTTGECHVWPSDADWQHG